jgi:hypothetical protein
MRHPLIIVVLLMAAAACSSPDRARQAGSPVAPSAATTAAATLISSGGNLGPMDVAFPSRADAFQFRNELEAKYQTGLNRGATLTYVDREGDVVWTQEYIRYRANFCDHATAVARVMAIIDGGAAGPICADNREFIVLFPPRDQVLDFRRQLETKYQQMGRAQQPTFVDIEGSVIWTQEYMRYRVNRCDHTTAVQKVFAQIDGGAPSATCGPTCAYVFSPGGRDLSGAQQTATTDLVGQPGGCGWTAVSDAPWLTFSADYAQGRDGVTIPYTVAQNVSGGPRVGRIRVVWDGGGFTSHIVNQDGSSFITTFVLTDPFRSGSQPTTECHLRSTATPCTFTATSNLPGAGGYTYTWTVSYLYGTTEKTSTITGPGATYTITDACGAPDAAATGAASDLNVTLTVTDSAGNTQTVRSGEGMQPALRIVKFTC